MEELGKHVKGAMSGGGKTPTPAPPGLTSLLFLFAIRWRMTLLWGVSFLRSESQSLLCWLGACSSSSLSLSKLFLPSRLACAAGKTLGMFGRGGKSVDLKEVAASGELEKVTAQLGPLFSHSSHHLSHSLPASSSFYFMALTARTAGISPFSPVTTTSLFVASAPIGYDKLRPDPRTEVAVVAGAGVGEEVAVGVRGRVGNVCRAGWG